MLMRTAECARTWCLAMLPNGVVLCCAVLCLCLVLTGGNGEGR